VVIDEDKVLPVSSSLPPEFPPEQRGLFVAVLKLLSAHHIPFAVSGAFALHEHTGIWRDTKDLDVFVADEQAPIALHALKDAGYTTEVRDPVWLCKVHSGGYFVDLITGMSNAVLQVDNEWIDRAPFADVLGVRVRVLAAEELIASKVFVTRRERFDGADLVHVIYGTAGKLDWQRILQLVGEHWMLLLWVLVLYQYCYPAHSEYVPRALWTDLLARLRRELEHTDPGAIFKGSLIDEKMFAIDVEEWGLPDINRQLRTARRTLLREEAA
jgi:nucleotidyltransferase DUF2204